MLKYYPPASPLTKGQIDLWREIFASFYIQIYAQFMYVVWFCHKIKGLSSLDGVASAFHEFTAAHAIYWIYDIIINLTTNLL